MKFWPSHPRQPCVALGIAALLGVATADFWEVSPMAAMAAATVGMAVMLWRPGILTCALFCGLVFFELHTCRHYHRETRFIGGLLAEGPRVVQATGFVWSEPAPPLTASRTITARFVLKTESLEMDGEKLTAPLLLSVQWAGPIPRYGDRVVLLGSAANLVEKRNPGQFDFAGYQRRRGIYSEIRARYATDCAIESHGYGQPAQAMAFRTSHWIQQQLRVDLEDSPQISDLIASMVLGLRGETPEEMRSLFQRTGTMHLFAVSGLNVAMLAWIIGRSLRLVGLRRGPAVFVILPVLAGYALVTGLSPSCVRATVMLTLILLGYVFDRRPLVLNSLGAAALLILGWDTEQLFSTGFQFSFVLVLAIVWLGVKIQRRLEPLGQPDAFLPRELWNSAQKSGAWIARQAALMAGVTLAAWVGSLAFTAGYFHLFSPAAIFANFLAVPLAFLVLLLGLAAISVAPLWAMGTVLFNNANWLCANVLLWVLEVFALLPGSYIYVETPRLSRAPLAEFTAFDLGEGGAAHVRAGNVDWLLDAGGVSDHSRILLPYLRSRGVNQLDGLLITHGDSRHAGGALGILADFQPRLFADSVLRDRSSTRRALHAEMQRQGLPKGLYERGDVIRLDPSASLRILYPPAGLRRSISDDMALAVQLRVGKTRALFMSDAGFSTEHWLLENEPDLRNEILIKGQHSRDLSGTPDFLARVQPQAIICSALGFGEMPSKLDEWARAVRQRGITVFRQDQAGAVQVEIREDGFALRGFVSGQTFRSRAE